ncbi:MAG: response regulator transcription factor [Chloroflexi bacterium]|nr:response regulator transcription factor [Chloroflexota bacterium]OQB01179.1 MAG: DNA-binding response regulator MtrA [Chloroflexi bacterium ADurb.Bin222]HOC20247.1 response regulator transcription factor [Anaerolineae bacterium]HOS79891.1 response regulator transcription factor [Anaerolineae bacterium]HQE98727.1 response regulator transcription factor [Anaerolineae bacterium]
MADAHILIVDDETAERVTLGEVLRLESFHVSLAGSGEEALNLLAQGETFDLVILDLRLPGLNGLQVLERLHKINPETLVILITGYGTLETAIQAMRNGAYDYLLKPCPVEDILATVRRGLSELAQERHRRLLLERLQRTVQELASVETPIPQPEAPEEERFLQISGVLIDRAKHLVTLKNQRIDLTPTEFRLLECLMQRADQVCTPQDLVRCAQGYEADPWGARSIIRVHIRRLRSKLEPDPEHPLYIQNVRGVGYTFVTLSDVSSTSTGPAKSGK